MESRVTLFARTLVWYRKCCSSDSKTPGPFLGVSLLSEIRDGHWKVSRDHGHVKPSLLDCTAGFSPACFRVPQQYVHRIIIIFVVNVTQETHTIPISTTIPRAPYLPTIDTSVQASSCSSTQIISCLLFSFLWQSLHSSILIHPNSWHSVTQVSIVFKI